jgi:hypothetical protein
MTFETELRDHLHAGVDDAPVDLGPLLTGAVAYGNKLVRRRRLARIFAGAATVAVLGGAFAYAGSLNDPVGNTPAPAAQVTATKKADITPQATLAILLDLLPDADLATNHRGGLDGTNRVTGVYSLVDYDTAWVQILVVKAPTAFTCGPKEPGCTTTTLPDGSVLRLLDIPVPGKPGESDNRQVQANLSRKDGLTVDLMVTDTQPAKPALTLAQVKAIVVSPRWQPQLDQSFLDRSEHLFKPRPVTPPSAPSSPGASK